MSGDHNMYASGNQPESAFPSTFKSLHPQEQQVHRWGMTLRDYFAAKAMAALYQSHYEYEFTGAPRMPEFQKQMDELAVDAYGIADAMLKARGESK